MARLIRRYVRNVIYRLNFESQSNWTVYNFKSVEILVFTIFAIYRRGYQFFEPSSWCEFEHMQNIFHKLVFHHKNIKNYSKMNSSTKNIKYLRFFLRSWHCFDFFRRGQCSGLAPEGRITEPVRNGEIKMLRWSGAIYWNYWVNIECDDEIEQLQVKRIHAGSEPEQNWIGSASERDRKQIFPQKTKCDVKIMTKAIRQSDEAEFLRRRKSFLQQCRRCGSDVSERCDNIREEILEPANEYRNRQNDVTERLEPARMLIRNPPNRGAAGRWKNSGLTNGDLRPIDKHEAANWRRTRPQENTEPAGVWGGKWRKNIDAAAYGRTCGKNTQSLNLEVPDCAGSKSSAPVNRNLAGKKLTRQLRGSGGRVANDAAYGHRRVSNAWRGARS